MLIRLLLLLLWCLLVPSRCIWNCDQPQQKSVDELRAEHEEKLMKECTFQPKIRDYKGSKRTGHSAAHGDAGGYTTRTGDNGQGDEAGAGSRARREVARQRRIAELAQDRRAVMERRQAEKARLEEEELKQYAFKPTGVNGSAGSDGAGGAARRGSAEPVGERLQKVGKLRQQRREADARLAQQAEEESFPFRPSINPDSELILEHSDGRYKPIHERIGDLQRAKHQNLHRLRMQHEEENDDLTFQPRINRRSSSMAPSAASHSTSGRGGSMGGQGQQTGRKSLSNVTDRLALQATERERRMQQRIRQHEQEEAEKHSFAPRISETSAKLVADNPIMYGSFLERQQRFEREKKRREALRGDLDANGAAKDCTFRPDIGNADDVLLARRPGRIVESQQATLERLTYRDSKQKEMAQTAMQEEYYSKFTFKPELNTVSRRLVPKAQSVDQLVANERGQRVREEAVTRAEAERLQDCTFKPEICKTVRSTSQGRSAHPSFSPPPSRPPQ